MTKLSMRSKESKKEIGTKMKGNRKDRVWRHNQPMAMHCGRCGGHVPGKMTREGPKWVFLCRGGHHVFKTLIRDKQDLIKEGLLHSGGLPDPRQDARNRDAREEGIRRREEHLYGLGYKELGRHRFI